MSISSGITHHGGVDIGTWTYAPLRERPGLTILCDLLTESRRTSWARRHGAVSLYLPTNEPSHVPTITLTGLDIEELDEGVGLFIEFSPMNKIPWAERLMASAALTGRTMSELCLPSSPWYLKEGLV